MSGEVHSRSGRRLQRFALLVIAGVIVLFSAILLTIMHSSQIQMATTIVAVVLLSVIAMLLYYL